MLQLRLDYPSITQVLIADNLVIDPVGGTKPDHPLLSVTSNPTLTAYGNVFPDPDSLGDGLFIEVDGATNDINWLKPSSWKPNGATPANFAENVSIRNDLSGTSFAATAVPPVTVPLLYSVTSSTPSDAEKGQVIVGEQLDFYANPRPLAGALTAGAVESLQPLTITGSGTNDQITLKRDPSSNSVDITHNGITTVSGLLSTYSKIVIFGSSGGESIIVDWTGGILLPTGGLSINGSATSFAQLTVIATAGNDIFTSATDHFTLGSFVTTLSNVGGVYLNPYGGTDSLSVTSGGLIIAAGALGGGIVTDLFSTLSITAGATLTVAEPTNKAHGDRKLLVVGSLTVAGKLDLWGSDLIVHNGNLGAISALVTQGSNNGNWNGLLGITSSAAATDTTRLTALGTILNNNGGIIRSNFDGYAPALTDVLVKYTYLGDSDLSGTVTKIPDPNATAGANDYLPGNDAYNMDNGFLGHLTGWYNGDFDYNGVVNGSDVTLLDNAFNMQGPAL